MSKLRHRAALAALTVLAAALFVFTSACSLLSPDIELSQKSIELIEGDTFRLAANVSGSIAWSSSDESVATVEDGLVTAVAVGEATISAEYNGATAKCGVTVVADDEATVPGGDNPGDTPGGNDPDPGDPEEPDPDDPEAPDVPVGPVDPDLPDEGDPDEPEPPEGGPWGDRELVWSDEFDGTSLDMTKWAYQTGRQDHYGSSVGPWAWGNNELQYYTEGDNVTVSDGTMKITAQREAMPDSATFSSSRIVTRDKYSFTYGYIEARIKMPAVSGLWPAFWMLPQPMSTANSNNEYGGWPNSGEIDIMEARGREPDRIDNTLHYSSGSWSSTYKTSKYIFDGSTISDWHTYGLEWTEDYIAWYVDGTEAFRLTSDVYWSSSAPDDDNAPFDVDFYILFNLAVGGNYDGGRVPPESFTSGDMEVDYVRVYQ